jgi:hypothetical protein
VSFEPAADVADEAPNYDLFRIDRDSHKITATAQVNCCPFIDLHYLHAGYVGSRVLPEFHCE